MSTLDLGTVTANWPLSSVSVGEAFSTYPTRKSFTVHAREGSFVAKVDLSPRRAPETLQVFEYLADRGFEHVPALLRTRDGALSVDLDGRRICMMEFVPEPIAVDDPERTWGDLGLVAARLNGHTDYPLPHAIPVGAAIQEMDRWVDGRPYEREYRELLDRVADVDDAEATGLVHGEIHTANARRRDDGTVVLLDWDEAGSGPTVIEYGYPLIGVFVDEQTLTFDEAGATAFYRGYREGGGEMDRSRLFAAALFHALRYTRFGDSDRRWRRIRYAVEQEGALTAVVG